MEVFGMENEKLSYGFLERTLRRLAKEGRGQVMAIFALALPVLVGSGAIAVDVGYMMTARNVLQNAADAGARAGTVVLAGGGTQAAASAAAAAIASQNTAGSSTLAGAVPVVSFPTATSVSVAFNTNLPLFLAPVIGINTAAIGANATAATAAVSSVPPNTMAPLAIACNNANGCAGSLAVGQTLTTRRYCGNFYADGPSGNACGNTIANGEIFMAGITFANSSNSNSAFRDAVENGYGDTVSMGQQARALPGNRNGWRSGMENRLAAGENELVLPVIREAANPSGNFNVEVADFIMVRISSFARAGNTDQTTFEIISSSVASTDFATGGEGLGINSTVGVRLSQ